MIVKGVFQELVAFTDNEIKYNDLHFIVKNSIISHWEFLILVTNDNIQESERNLLHALNVSDEAIDNEWDAYDLVGIREYLEELKPIVI